MSKHRYKISFFITTMLYISLFLIYIFMMNEHFIVSQKVKDKTINLSISQFVPKAVEQPKQEEKQEEPVVEKEQEIKPEIIKPKIIPEPIIIEKTVVKPKPVIIKKVIKKIKIKKKIVKKTVHKKIVKKRAVHKKTKTVKKKQKASKASSRRASSRRIDPNKKSLFLSQIRAKINRAKSYPRIAKKRGMQGVLKVRFTILSNGHVGNISLQGPKVFYNSARTAIKKAFPVNVSKVPLSLPITVNLTLRYQLR